MSIRAKLDILVPANKAYRNGTPIMTDPDYDALLDEMIALVDLCDEDDNDPAVVEARAFIASIGAAPDDDSKWAKVTHALGMTSLNKAQGAQDFSSWVAGLGVIRLVATRLYVVSDKCDGISISLRYEAGKLILAATRGDGVTGEDITRNVVRMKGVKTYIKGLTGNIRGEIVLLKSDWKKHFPNAVNPRNMAAGVAKREDGVGCEHLTVLHYQIIRDDAVIARKTIEFQVLERLGCAVPAWACVASIAEVQAIYDAYVAGRRDALDYDIDGLVVECDSTAEMESLGDLNGRPKGAIAYKFPPMIKGTILRDVRWQVGKSGRITPVAVFDSVFLAGANVTQASLHNVGNITKLLASSVRRAGQLGPSPRLTVGDEIVVSRRNDVIPYVEEVLRTSASGTDFVVPTHCPECGTSLVMDGEYLVCRGEDCPAQVLGGISRWVKKIGVLGMGDSIIEALIEHAGVTDAADLYALDPAKIEGIVTSSGSRLGRTAYNILDELKSKSEVPLHTFVGSLGIPDTGRSICKSIVDAGFDTLDKMEAATVTQIASIAKMGPTKAQKFVDGFRARRTLMDKLQDNGVTIKALSVGVMTGKSVCFTGVRSPEMEKAIEDAGGTVKGSVGAGLTYLVQKDKTSQSGKTKDALKHGVTITDLDGMWAILGRTPGTGAVQLTAARTMRKATPVTPPVKAPAPVNALSMFAEDDD